MAWAAADDTVPLDSGLTSLDTAVFNAVFGREATYGGIGPGQELLRT